MKKYRIYQLSGIFKTNTKFIGEIETNHNICIGDYIEYKGNEDFIVKARQLDGNVMSLFVRDES